MKEKINLLDGLKGENELEESLLKVLVSQFQYENDKLGLGLPKEKITSLGKGILKAPGGPIDLFRAGMVKEDSSYDTYEKEDFKIFDYFPLVSRELRKQLGQFFTPSVIVKYILKSVKYIPSDTILKKRLIDPACGSGVFLVEALRVYLIALQRTGVPLHEWYPMVVSAFAGIDIDPKACLFSRFNLASLLAPAILCWTAKDEGKDGLPLPIYCGDTLRLVSTDKIGPKLFCFEQINIPLKGEFDFVVGNPPYHKIRSLRKEIKDAFKESLYGHPNAYGLFLHAGLEMLRHGGTLGFIVPRSMLSGLYFHNLRHFIETKASLLEIVPITDRKKVFDKVLQGTMILSLIRQKEPDQSNPKLSITPIHSLQDLEKTNTPRIIVDQQRVVKHLNGTKVWFIADAERTYDLLDRIITGHPLLSGPEINCPAKTGQIVWNRVKPLLTTRYEHRLFPLIWATDVGRFDFSFNTAGPVRPGYLKVTPKTDKLIVQGQCILVQRVTADEQPCRIVACIPEEFCYKHTSGYFVENHLNFIQPASATSPMNLFYLLGILNSQVVEFFFRAMNGNTQVSATELNLLPIPLGKEEIEIAHISRKIQNTLEPMERDALLKELNLKVAMAYGLSPEDLEFIGKSLALRYHSNHISSIKTGR